MVTRCIGLIALGPSLMQNFNGCRQNFRVAVRRHRVQNVKTCSKSFAGITVTLERRYYNMFKILTKYRLRQRTMVVTCGREVPRHRNQVSIFMTYLRTATNFLACRLSKYIRRFEVSQNESHLCPSLGQT